MKSLQLSERAELEYRVEHKSVKKINPEGDFPELSGRRFSKDAKNGVTCCDGRENNGQEQQRFWIPGLVVKRPTFER